MPVVKIAPAKREGMKLLISLFGLSETGKTMSALRLACGIEPDPSKRGLLDTEGGERGRAYVDAIPGGYMYGALTAPFTPERYMEALSDFVAAGVTTLVVDSVSHAWFAAGGILDMVEQATEKNDMAKWAKPKRRLGKLTGQWLGCGLHLILCARGKQPLTEEVIDGRKKLIPGPVIPVQEKSLRFDMTIMAHMLGDGQFSVDRADGGKCPGPLRPIFAAGEVMDEAMGTRLIEWIGGQDAISPEQRQVRMAADQAALEGATGFAAFWRRVPQHLRDYLRPDMDNFRSIAASADAEAERIRQAEMVAATPTDEEDPFGTATERPALSGGVRHASLSPAPLDDEEDTALVTAQAPPDAENALASLLTEIRRTNASSNLNAMLSHASTNRRVSLIAGYPHLVAQWASAREMKQRDLGEAA